MPDKTITIYTALQYRTFLQELEDDRFPLSVAILLGEVAIQVESAINEFNERILFLWNGKKGFVYDSAVATSQQRDEMDQFYIDTAQKETTTIETGLTADMLLVANPMLTIRQANIIMAMFMETEEE